GEGQHDLTRGRVVDLRDDHPAGGVHDRDVRPEGERVVDRPSRGGVNLDVAVGQVGWRLPLGVEVTVACLDQYVAWRAPARDALARRPLWSDLALDARRTLWSWRSGRARWTLRPWWTACVRDVDDDVGL